MPHIHVSVDCMEVGPAVQIDQKYGIGHNKHDRPYSSDNSGQRAIYDSTCISVPSHEMQMVPNDPSHPQMLRVGSESNPEGDSVLGESE